MTDAGPPRTITTSDHCPRCGTVEIQPRDGPPPAGTTAIWQCSRCGFVFYRYRGRTGR